MKTTVESLSSVSKKIIVELTPEMVGAELDKIIVNFSNNVEIKGFRKGKVPRDVVIARYKNDILNETSQSLVSESYYKALDAESLAPIAYPRITKVGEVKRGETFSYEAEIEVSPELHFDEYKGYELKIKTSAYKQHGLDAALKQIQQTASTREDFTEDRPFGEAGDMAEISYVIKKDDETVTFAEGEKHFMEFGKTESTLYPDLSKAVASLTVGQSTQLTLTMGDSFSLEAYRGKEALVEVTLLDRKVVKLPEINEEFATRYGFTSVNSMKDKLQNMLNQKEAEGRRGLIFHAFCDIMIEKNSFEVPNVEVQDTVTNEIYKALHNAGIHDEKTLKNMSEADSIRKSMLESSTKIVKQGYVARYVIGKENIAITDEQKEARIAVLAEEQDLSVEKFKKQLHEDDDHVIASNLLFEQCVDRIASFSKIVEEN